MAPRVLHIFKKSYSGPKHHYLGSVKDIRSRTEFFHQRGIEYEEFLVSVKYQYRDALEKLPDEFLARFDAVLLEMTFSPDALKTLRQRMPNAILMVRSHNAELIHRTHWARAQGLSRSAARFLGQAVKNCILDLLSGRRADFILPITKWEAEFYWSHLVSSQKIRYVPFFLPESYTSELKLDAPKRDLCIHFGSSLSNPMITDATKNFIRAVSDVDSAATHWEFCVTGAQPAGNLKIPDRIQWLGMLPDPYTVLRQSRAMALLSNFGMGFKTKILEAVVARVFVILPLALYQRQPPELLPYCIPVDMKVKHSFQEALERCAEDFPEGSPNDELRRQAFGVLDQILALRSTRKNS